MRSIWHILLFGGTAVVFFTMTIATLFHLRWARRLPSLAELLGGIESPPKNRPTPDPSQEGSKRSSASCQFLSWEELGVGSTFPVGFSARTSHYQAETTSERPFLDADGDGKPELFRKLLPGAAIILCER